MPSARSRALRGLAALALLPAVALAIAPTATANDPYGTLTIEKVDESGNLLPGGQFKGVSCTKYENDLTFQCQALNEYGWFQTKTPEEIAELEATYEDWTYTPPTTSLDGKGTTGDYFGEEIPLRGGWGGPLQNCVGVIETKAPAGYVPNPQPIVVCKGKGAGTAPMQSRTVSR